MRSSRGVAHLTRIGLNVDTFHFSELLAAHSTGTHMACYLSSCGCSYRAHLDCSFFYLFRKRSGFFGSNSTRNIYISSKQQFKLDLLSFAYKSTGFHDTLNCMPFVKSITTHLLYDYVAIEIAIDSNSDNVSANHF